MAYERSEALRILDTKKRRKHLIRSVVYHAGIGLIGLGMIYPILWMFSASLKETSEIWTDVSALIPRSVHLENYSNGWEGFGDYSFSVFYSLV
jgi:multiple sugar transport system permease protein